MFTVKVNDDLPVAVAASTAFLLLPFNKLIDFLVAVRLAVWPP